MPQRRRLGNALICRWPRAGRACLRGSTSNIVSLDGYPTGGAKTSWSCRWTTASTPTTPNGSARRTPCCSADHVRGVQGLLAADGPPSRRHARPPGDLAPRRCDRQGRGLRQHHRGPHRAVTPHHPDRPPRGRPPADRRAQAPVRQGHPDLRQPHTLERSAGRRPGRRAPPGSRAGRPRGRDTGLRQRTGSPAPAARHAHVGRVGQRARPVRRRRPGLLNPLTLTAAARHTRHPRGPNAPWLSRPLRSAGSRPRRRVPSRRDTAAVDARSCDRRLSTAGTPRPRRGTSREVTEPAPRLPWQLRPQRRRPAARCQSSRRPAPIRIASTASGSGRASRGRARRMSTGLSWFIDGRSRHVGASCRRLLAEIIALGAGGSSRRRLDRFAQRVVHPFRFRHYRRRWSMRFSNNWQPVCVSR